MARRPRAPAAAIAPTRLRDPCPAEYKGTYPRPESLWSRPFPRALPRSPSREPGNRTRQDRDARPHPGPASCPRAAALGAESWQQVLHPDLLRGDSASAHMEIHTVIGLQCGVGGIRRGPPTPPSGRRGHIGEGKVKLPFCHPLSFE